MAEPYLCGDTGVTPLSVLAGVDLPLEGCPSKAVGWSPDAAADMCKGSPDAPRCGFSRQIAELLAAEKVKFDSFDILSDEEVRQGLKTFSNWPTYPQLYYKSELIGGCDIILELAQAGELAGELGAA